MADTTSVNTAEDGITWYELHDCDGCGLRIPIGGSKDEIEEKIDYNCRRFHDPDCAALARRKEARHGTYWGYKLCSERPEGACEVCKEANARRQRPKQAARNKALRRLGQMFPSKLAEFVQEEMNDGEYPEV
jgi:hypothetical protein